MLLSMSDRFGDEEVRRILSEAARLAVERADKHSSGGLAYEEIVAAAAESGIDQNILDEAIGRSGGRLLLVQTEDGAHARKISWKPGEPGKWLKYPCQVPGCEVRSSCPIARWEHVVISCEEVYQLKPSLGQIAPAPRPDGHLVRSSPNGRYLLFTANPPGATLQEIFLKLRQEYGPRCAHALGVIDLSRKKAGLLFASPAPIEPVWTGPTTFRLQLHADLFTLARRGKNAHFLARLPGKESQIFVHLGDDPAHRSLTRVDVYRLEA